MTMNVVQFRTWTRVHEIHLKRKHKEKAMSGNILKTRNQHSLVKRVPFAFQSPLKDMIHF